MAARAFGVSALVLLAAAVGQAIASTSVESEPLVWASLLLAACVGLLACAAVRGTFDLFSPVTIVLGLIVVQFPLQTYFTVLVSRYGTGVLPVGQWAQLLDLALASAALACAAFLAGYLLPLGIRAGAGSRNAPSAGRWGSGRVSVVVTSFSAIGFATYVRFVHDSGGLAFLLHNLQARIELAAGRHALLAGVALLPLASLIWFASLVSRGALRSPRMLAVFTGHAALTSFILFSLGGRSNLIEYWLTLFVVFHYGVRRLGIRFAVGFLAVAVAFLAIAGWYRASTAASSNAPRFTPGQILSPRAVAEEFFNYDISPLDVYVLALDKVPRQIPYRLGGSIADTVYQPIPRSMLSAKPPVLTAWYKLHLLNRTDPGGVRASALGEGYVNFGLVGVAGLLFAYGLLCRAFRRFATCRDPFALVLYALTVQLIVQLTIGTFDESTVNFLEHLLPLLVVARFLRSSFAPRYDDLVLPAAGEPAL